jgi:hypothetical protein
MSVTPVLFLYDIVQLTNNDICLGNLGTERIFNPQTVGIRKENFTENIRTHKRKPVVEN